VPKTYRPKPLKSTFSIIPLSFDAPSPENPCEYPHKPYVARNYTQWPTFLSLIVWVYLHSIFGGGLRKTHLLWNRMRIGHSKSSKVVDFCTNRKGECDFLTLVLSCTVSEIRRVIGWRLRIFPTPPLFDAPVQAEPVRISGWNLPRKNYRGMGLLYGENCMIVTSTVFDWSTRVTDRQTDRQTELR